MRKEIKECLWVMVIYLRNSFLEIRLNEAHCLKGGVL